MKKLFVFLCVMLLSFGISRIVNAQDRIIHLDDVFPWGSRGPVGQSTSKDTFGQTFTVDVDSVLNSFTFILDDSDTNVEFIAFVMKWDGVKADAEVGILFEADGSTADAVSGGNRDTDLEGELADPIDGVVDADFWNTWKAITIDTTIGNQGLDLIPGQYVVFFTTAAHCDAAGMVVYDHDLGSCNIVDDIEDFFHDKVDTWKFFHLNWGPEPTPNPLVDFAGGNLVLQNSFHGSVEQISRLTMNDWFDDTGFVGGSYFGSDAAFVMTFSSPIPPTPSEQLTTLIDNVQDIVDVNQGTLLAYKVDDAIDYLQNALDELNKTPPDNQAAVGNIEGAVGDLEAAIGLDPAQDPTLTDLMDQLAGVARQLAEDALDQAIAEGGDPTVIADAQQALEDGDLLRASGAFKDAVNKYKDALAKAESVLA